MAINLTIYNWKLLVLLLSVYVQTVTSLWEYAICTKQNIIFYDTNWNEVAEAASKNFENLKAITYDTTHNVFYFTDRHGDVTYINSLKLRNDGSWTSKILIELNEKEMIEDIVYDFNDDILFLSDKRKILKISFDRTDSENVKPIKEIFLNITNGSPSGLELDTCKRHLYYTILSGSSTINSISIKDMQNEIICKNCEKYRPNAIAMDPRTDRIYIADKKSNVYYINSFTSDSDFKQELKAIDKTPRSIAVDHEYVYYVDGSEHSLRRLLKHRKNDEISEFMIKFKQDPTDIIVKSSFIDAINVDLEKCDITKERLEEVMKRKDDVKREEVVCQKASLTKPKKTCLHGGIFDEDSSNCICKDSRYDGDNCEIDLCYNFCMNGGECSVEIDTRPVAKCSCTKGFIGDRCEIDVCLNYCFNNGKCSVDSMKRPVCECTNANSGKRCENDHFVEQPVEIATTKSIRTTTEEADDDDERENRNMMKCPIRMNLTYVILGVCFTLSLLFFLIIMLVIHRLHKPVRPKIRKKYVVHKNIEPLTCRPTTEQCEVIIEDCCNMNICETPCFDPKILQQEINEKNIKVKLTTSKKCSSKEDKQDLLNNMEHNQ
ncbi:hypothetical protein ACKWTF_007799 [Chironomus riparius]